DDTEGLQQGVPRPVRQSRPRGLGPRKSGRNKYVARVRIRPYYPDYSRLKGRIRVASTDPIAQKLTGLRGAIAELTVSADLMRRGYEVFAPVGSLSASFDLVAAKGPVLLRIEVKHGQVDVRSAYRYVSAANDRGETHADVVAGVLDGGILYADLTETPSGLATHLLRGTRLLD